MKPKTFLVAALVSLASVAAPQTASAIPAAPIASNQAVTQPTLVHDRLYWRYGQPYWNGYRGYPYRRPGYYPYGGYWFPHSAFSYGIIIAPAPSMRTYQLTEAHYRWCERRYRSYRRWDNTFQPYYGPRKQCVSPYLR